MNKDTILIKLNQHTSICNEKKALKEELDSLMDKTHNGLIFRRVVGGYREANLSEVESAIEQVKIYLSGASEGVLEGMVIPLNKIINPQFEDLTCIIGVTDVEDASESCGYIRKTTLNVYADYYLDDNYIIKRSDDIKIELGVLCNKKRALECELSELGVEF